MFTKEWNFQVRFQVRFHFFVSTKAARIHSKRHPAEDKTPGKAPFIESSGLSNGRKKVLSGGP